MQPKTPQKFYIILMDKRSKRKKLFEELSKDKEKLRAIAKFFEKREKKEMDNCKNIYKGLENIREYIGLKIKVIHSSSTFKGKKGFVLLETKNSFKILTLHKMKSYKIIDIPKKGNVFELSLKGERFMLKGEEIAFSPIERPKRMRKWKG